MTADPKPVALRWTPFDSDCEMAVSLSGQFVLYSDHQQAIDALRAEVSSLRAARIAYANEFPPDADGDPDVGNIHANLRALKERAQRAEAQAAELREALNASEKALRVAAHALAHASEGNNVYTDSYLTVDAALSRAANDTQAGGGGA